MIWEGDIQDAPVDQPGWAQREPSPAELSPNDNLGIGGRMTMNWRKPTSALEVAPVVVGRDPLRDEPIIDEEATKRREIDLDEVNRRLMPKESSTDEKRKRELEYWQWAAPSMFADFIEQCPEEAARLGFQRESVGSTPEEVQDIPIEQTPTPPVEPEPTVSTEPVDQLEELLKLEVAALNDGNEERLVEIRAKIEEAMK
ncbi:hypothetical protein ES708_11269 [subsurface metagenome]